MRDILLEMAQEYDKDLISIKAQITLLEGIYRKKKTDIIKDILKKLYEERDYYANRANFYRALHTKSKNS